MRTTTEVKNWKVTALGLVSTNIHRVFVIKRQLCKDSQIPCNPCSQSTIISTMPTPPSDIALTKTVKDRMKMIREALPNKLIIFLTTCCPTNAATVATPTKYRA